MHISMGQRMHRQRPVAASPKYATRYKANSTQDYFNARQRPLQRTPADTSRYARFGFDPAPGDRIDHNHAQLIGEYQPRGLAPGRQPPFGLAL